MQVQLDEVADRVWHVQSTHVGWMLVTDGDGVTVVDTGCPGDREALLHSLERIGRSPADVAAVLLTHAHPDHIGSAAHLGRTAPAPVLTHELEASHTRDGPQPAMPFFDADHDQALRTLAGLAGIGADVVVSGHGPAFHGPPSEAVRVALSET